MLAGREFERSADRRDGVLVQCLRRQHEHRESIGSEKVENGLCAADPAIRRAGPGAQRLSLGADAGGALLRHERSLMVADSQFGDEMERAGADPLAPHRRSTKHRQRQIAQTRDQTTVGRHRRKHPIGAVEGACGRSATVPRCRFEAGLRARRRERLRASRPDWRRLEGRYSFLVPRPVLWMWAASPATKTRPAP